MLFPVSLGAGPGGELSSYGQHGSLGFLASLAVLSVATLVESGRAERQETRGRATASLVEELFCYALNRLRTP